MKCETMNNVMPPAFNSFRTFQIERRIAGLEELSSVAAGVHLQDLDLAAVGAFRPHDALDDGALPRSVLTQQPEGASG
nr:hypothetical protein [Adlercreutzia sp. ZJ242]